MKKETWWTVWYSDGSSSIIRAGSALKAKKYANKNKTITKVEECRGF